MQYSNSEPTQAVQRKRTFMITCDSGLSEKDFEEQYKWPIRRTNASYSDCAFVIMSISDADKRVELFLRELGVSPARITIYYLDRRTPENQYKSETKMYQSQKEMEDAMISVSSHDILWTLSTSGDTMVERIAKKRKEKQRTNPFKETM